LTFGGRVAYDSAMDLSVATVAVGSWSVVVVLGELDMATAPMLRAELRRLVNGGAIDVAVDLDGVGFCDSIGLGVLVGARRRMLEAGGRFALITDSPRLAKLLDVTAVSEIMAVLASRHDLPA
jgi:anti-sigma B factor antagonist